MHWILENVSIILRIFFNYISVIDNKSITTEMH